jgi:hypothetical protein
MDISRRLCAMWTAIVVAGAMAAAAYAQPAATAADELAAAQHAWLKRVFDVPQNLSVDPGLREAGEAMAQALLDRMRPILRTWIEEERARVGASAPSGDVDRHVLARLVNELALWQLDRVGGEHEQAWLEVAQKPGICRADSTDSLFARRLLWLQAATPARRTAMQAGEVELLRRFGTLRDAVPERPTVPAFERAERLLQQIKSGGARPPVAMPPVLAAQLFGPDDSVDALAAESRCALHQWWLQNALRDTSPKPDEAALVFRYAQLADASRLLSVPPAASADKAQVQADGYPDLARSFIVQGRIVVEALVDEQGRLRRARVIQRDLNVPGIHGIRPVAFETTLDQASTDRAKTVKFQKPDPAKLKGGESAQRIEFVWRLE